MNVLTMKHTSGITYTPVAPQTMSLTIFDLSSETTNRSVSTGELLLDRVAQKRKIECGWQVLTAVQLSYLLKAVRADVASGSSGNITFDMTYKSPFTQVVDGEHTIPNVTGKFYVGDKTMELLSYDTDANKTYYRNIKLNFIEV